MLILTDITNFMNWWIQVSLGIARQTYNTLDTIEFYNVSLLELLITINIIIIFITIVLPKVSKKSIGMESERRR